MASLTQATPTLTPMMLQWQSCKEEAPSCLLLFRMGDFYEAFFEDAEILAKEADVTLTKRGGVPMSGIPFHAAESYLDKLVVKGHKVAIAEQVEDPKLAKGLVKRKVVRVISPGSLIGSSLLSEKQNNYFCSLSNVGKLYGLATTDLSTAEFCVFETDSFDDLKAEIFRLLPKELLIGKKTEERLGDFASELQLFAKTQITSVEDWQYDFALTFDRLIRHFGTDHLDGFGLKGMNIAISAAGALIGYLKDSLKLDLHHLQSIAIASNEAFLKIDPAAERHLELTESQDGLKSHYTLFSILDQTKSPLGARALRQMIKKPLYNCKAIQERQALIGLFLESIPELDTLRAKLSSVRDIERLFTRLSSTHSPRDLLSLASSWKSAVDALSLIKHFQTPLIQQTLESINFDTSFAESILEALDVSPPLRPSEGGIFKPGYNQELDELRKFMDGGKNWLADYQTHLRDTLGIKTARISFNKVFGYSIEVSRALAAKMPENFEKKQTLVNTERFISQELKEYEEKALGAEEKAYTLEETLFKALEEKIFSFLPTLQKITHAVALIDAMASLAYVAYLQGYTKPEVDESDILEITEGRHPVVETNIRTGFVPNDVSLNHADSQLILITGPNMAGKSTYIRQVALLVIMAQMGSYIPAKKARIGLVDKVFTRIGASDDLARGQSTFMVEMSETACILHNATSKSLVILDEIGRGTSTYDGISLAWAIAQFLLTHEEKKARTLFATHYWELTLLDKHFSGVKNAHISVREWEGKIHFLHKIMPGSADKSYGIHVAELAGLPKDALRFAKEKLRLLEGSQEKGIKVTSRPPVQMELFPSDAPEHPNASALINMVQGIDLNNTTPLDALAYLQKLKALL